MDRQQRVIGTVALVLAVLLAAVVVFGVVRGAGSGSWVVASTASVLMAAAVSQWSAVRARARGGRLLRGELVLLVVAGVVGMALCAVDYVNGSRDDRGFTILFAAGLIIVVGGTIGTYGRSRPSAAGA